MGMPPSVPKSACKVSPLRACTTRVNEPASTRCPTSTGTPCWPSLLASQARPPGGAPGFSELGMALHDAAAPAQIDIERADWPSADHDAGGSAVIGDGIE